MTVLDVHTCVHARVCICVHIYGCGLLKEGKRFEKLNGRLMHLASLKLWLMRSNSDVTDKVTEVSVGRTAAVETCFHLPSVLAQVAQTSGDQPGCELHIWYHTSLSTIIANGNDPWGL